MQNLQINRPSFCSTGVLYTTNNKTPQTSLYVSQEKQKPEQKTEQKIFAKNLHTLGINFKARSDEDKTIEELNNEYNWYVNCDGARPLDAFMKIRTNKEKMNQLFCEILQDKERSYHLINDIAGRAREGVDNYRTLRTLLGDNETSNYFYSHKYPYIKAFEAYMDERYKNAKSINELLKLRPDWKESALIDKYKELTGNTDLKIGRIPVDFKDGQFEKICDYLQKYMQSSNFKRKEEIAPLTIDGKTYEFEYFTEGKTDKNVFGVYTDGKKYVFKMADPNKKSLNNPFSLGVLALIDGYLTLNKCRNIARLYYYDHNRNTSIYQYQEHNTVHQKLNSLTEVNHYMPDFKALGMCYNDTVGNDNYFLSDVDCQDSQKGMYYNYITNEEKELISVDNDHVTYSSPFMLKVDKYNIYLPNAMQNAF